MVRPIDFEMVSEHSLDKIDIMVGARWSLYTGQLVCTMNSSLNYYLYLFLSRKEKKQGYQGVENQRTTRTSEQTELKTL